MQYLEEKKPKLLLQICCIGCGAYITDMLKSDYEIILFFYNPNIFPEEEYKRRLEETKKISDKLNINLIIGDYNHDLWLKNIEGLEKEREKGRRCLVCYEDRLRGAAQKARELECDYFTTTLTVSPHKLAKEISKIGNKLALEYSVKYLDKDFKKQDGFKKAVEFSRKLNLYRQDYCGCEFSVRK